MLVLVLVLEIPACTLIDYEQEHDYEIGQSPSTFEVALW